MGWADGTPMPAILVTTAAPTPDPVQLTTDVHALHVGGDMVGGAITILASPTGAAGTFEPINLLPEMRYLKTNGGMAEIVIPAGYWIKVTGKDLGVGASVTVTLDPTGSERMGNGDPAFATTVNLSNKTTVGGTPATVGAATTLNLLNNTTGWLDVNPFNGISLTVATDGTHATGAVIFEGTDDLTITGAAPQIMLSLDNSATAIEVSTTGALGANAVVKYSGQIPCRYIKARLSTAPTAGSLRVTATLTQMPIQRRVHAVRLTDGTNLGLAMDAAARSGYQRITDGTSIAAIIATFLSLKTDLSTIAGQVASNILEQGQTASPLMQNVMLASATTGNLTEVASAARTTSGNSGTITTKVGAAMGAVINVTAIAGTPTLDVFLEESLDNGATWRTIYECPRLTGVGTINVPARALHGRRRWSWTIGGSTPSLTFSIVTTGSNMTPERARTYFDRTAGVLAGTLNATTAAKWIEGCGTVSAKVTLGAATTPGTYQIQVSDDNGNWASVGTAKAAVANATVEITATGIAASFARLICTGAATAQTGTQVSFGVKD